MNDETITDSRDCSRLRIMSILDHLREHVVVDKYPKKKSTTIKFGLPNYICGMSIQKYLSTVHKLTKINQEFIVENLRYCRYIQPDPNRIDGFITVGNPNSNCPVNVITTTSYGRFVIHGRRVIVVNDPKDINCSIKTYICSNGITAHVLTYMFKEKYIKEVYYGCDLDDLFKYLKLMASPSLMHSYSIQSKDLILT